MRAMQFTRPGPIEDMPLTPVDVPVPRPGAGQALVRVLACGVCHTDLHICQGEIHPPQLPLIPGHQVVGEIDALGEGVTHLQIGQRVGLPWLYSACGVCEFCRRGEENLCPQARFTGFSVDGGFAEWTLAEADYLLPIPAQISTLQAAPLLCAGIIGFRSLRLAGVQPGEHLGLFGFGASAHLALQVARYWNCTVSVFTRSARHRAHAESLGADWTGIAGDTPPRPLDRAVTFAPAGEIVPAALSVLRPGGTLAINAVHMSDLPAMPYERIYGERTLRSVANATYQDGVDFLDLAAEIPLQATVQTYGLEDANEALLDVAESRINGEAVLTISQSLTAFV